MVKSIFGFAATYFILISTFVLKIGSMLHLAGKRVRVVTFDVTGTLLVHKYPIVETYADAAQWALLPNAPTAAELKPAFKQAYKECLLKQPCFRANDVSASREWWYTTVHRAVELTGRKYSNDEFNRFFRRVYQHYGSMEGYEVLDDTLPLLNWLKDKNIPMGIITNTPARTVETVLPMLGLHNYFKFFICCQDIGVEKPGHEIFDAGYKEAMFWENQKLNENNPLKRADCLHLGDSFAADFCGKFSTHNSSIYSNYVFIIS